MFDQHPRPDTMNDLGPVSRRRAMSDSRHMMRPRFKLIPRRSVSPPHLKVGKDIPQTQGGPPRIPSLVSSDYGSSNALDGSAPTQIPNRSAPINIYVGSPLGSGPLNGNPLGGLANYPHEGSPVSSASPPTYDITPMRRPRLSSLSEAPSVAPIPENLPLENTPPRPPLNQEMSPLSPIALATLPESLSATSDHVSRIIIFSYNDAT